MSLSDRFRGDDDEETYLETPGRVEVPDNRPPIYGHQTKIDGRWMYYLEGENCTEQWLRMPARNLVEVRE
ncbi:hypothetical protein SAMN05421858_5090 [Haladaptatus litoreus]|uniref:Uncharacterized protein n=1 Tax=Haladaptatus litoreus TaxID=553468 RepID=A0A1N7FI62_9EURY|nr:hypothetical protein [Haladaptatus litoreus]SIS00042.1 hypothetical protein SAMN05421858_5090 [Haladaptatus litoreus]